MQAARLSERYDIAVLATGELLQANVDQGTALGRQAPAYLDEAEMVADDLLIATLLADCDARPDAGVELWAAISPPPRSGSACGRGSGECIRKPERIVSGGL